MWLEVSIVVLSLLLLFGAQNLSVTWQTKLFFKTLKFADVVEELPEDVYTACNISKFMKNDKLVCRFTVVGEPMWRLELTENVVTFIRYPIY